MNLLFYKGYSSEPMHEILRYCATAISCFFTSTECPSLENTHSLLAVEVTSDSVIIVFDVNGQTGEPSGYLIQYRLQTSPTWLNGTRIHSVEDAESDDISMDHLQPDSTYYVQIVPLLDHDRTTSLGIPSPPTNITTAMSMGNGSIY